MRIEKHLKKSLQIEIMFQAALYGQTEHKLSVPAWIHWRVRMRKMFETLSMLECGIRHPALPPVAPTATPTVPVKRDPLDQAASRKDYTNATIRCRPMGLCKLWMVE